MSDVERIVSPKRNGKRGPPCVNARARIEVIIVGAVDCHLGYARRCEFHRNVIDASLRDRE